METLYLSTSDQLLKITTELHYCEISEWDYNLEWVKCSWCSSDFDIESRGFLSIKTHSDQKKHIATAKIRQGRNNRQGVLAVVGQDNNNDIPAEVAAQAGQETINDEQRSGERGGGDGGAGAGRLGGGSGERVK